MRLHGRSDNLSQVALAYLLEPTHSQAAGYMCPSCLSRTSYVQPWWQGTTTVESLLYLLGSSCSAMTGWCLCRPFKSLFRSQEIFQIGTLLTSSSLNLRQSFHMPPLVASSGYLCGYHLPFGLEEKSTCDVTYSLCEKLVHWTSSAENHYRNISAEWRLNSISSRGIFPVSVNWSSHH